MGKTYVYFFSFIYLYLFTVSVKSNVFELTDILYSLSRFTSAVFTQHQRNAQTSSFILTLRNKLV